MSVVERGIWVDRFPLEGGGCVHMKLQFSLSEEDRTRIREMRDSALKNKHGELLKVGLINSLSEQNTKGARINQLQQTDPSESALERKHGELLKVDLETSLCEYGRSSNQSVTANRPNECGDSVSSASLQKLEEHSDESFEQALPHPDEVSQEISEIQPPPGGVQERHISLEKCLDTYIGCSGSLLSGNVTKNISSTTSPDVGEDQIHSPKKKNLLQRSLNSNIRKMISAFESNTSQGLGPHASKSDIGDSFRRASSIESNTKKTKLPQTMAKSFSAGTLSDISFQQNPKFFKSLIVNRKEDSAHLDHSARWETTGENNPFLDFKTGFKNHETYKHKVAKVKDDGGSSEDILHIAQSQSSMGTNTLLRPIETEETDSLSGFAEHVSEREDPIPFQVGKSPIISLDAEVAHGASDTIPLRDNCEELEALESKEDPTVETNQSRDKMDDGIGAIEQTATTNFQSPEVNFELVGKEESKNEEHTLLEEDHLPRNMLHGSVYVDEPCSNYTDQYGSSFGAIITDYDCRGHKSHSDEQTVSGSPIEIGEVSTYYDYEKWPFRSLGIWIPRHLCTTTGTKQLKNLVECCNVHNRTHPVEKKSSSMEANEKVSPAYCGENSNYGFAVDDASIAEPLRVYL